MFDRPSAAPAAVSGSAATRPVRVGLAGASGFAGRELVRLLARHPGVELTAAMSSGGEGPPRPLDGFARIWDGDVLPLSVDHLAGACDVAILALPDAAAARVAPALVAAGCRVIDLSGVFRLRDRTALARWYPQAAGASTVTGEAVYGLTELHRDAIGPARLVANPGCYPTAALLALQPLAAAGLLDEHADLVIDAKSGISGAGRTPTDRTHFSNCHGSVAAYGVFDHRHEPEITQAIERAVTFLPHLVPLDRGILATMYARLQPGAAAAAVERAFVDAYAGAAFIRLRGGDLPEIRQVAHTNFCDIGWRIDPASSRLVLVACLDNLLKGAASQAVQNMNTMFGLDERTGLV